MSQHRIESILSGLSDGPAKLEYVDGRGVPHTIGVEVVYLNANSARELLELNVGNRAPKPVKQKEFLRDMVNGRWQFNGEAIKIDTDNVVRDGQNRLLALAQTDGLITIPFLLVTGIEPEAQKTMDQGTKRSGYDQLHISGIEADRTTAAAIRQTILWDRGGLFGSDKTVTAPEIVEWAEANPSKLAIINEFVTNGLAAKVNARTGLVLAAALRFTVIDRDDAHEFFTALATGANLDVNSPVMALRTRFEKAIVSKLRMSELDTLGFLTVAWNSFREGGSLTKLQRPKGGTWTVKNFPRPV